MDAVAQFRGFDETHLASFGRTAGSERMMLLAEAAEKNRPQLAQFDAYGEYSSFRYSMCSVAMRTRLMIVHVYTSVA